MWERLRASGGNVDVLDTDSFTDSERAVGRLVMPALSDLENAKQTIEALSARTRALTVALDVIPVAAIVIDADGRFILSNANAQQLLGGVAIPESLLAAARTVTRTEDPVDSVRVVLANGRPARLVGAELDASDASAPHVVFVVSEDGQSGSIDPRLLMARLQLTPMQARVVSLVSSGLANREVAERLGLSTETVRKHLATAYARTGVRNRAAIVALAYDVRFGGTSPVSN